ncbi:hypothetical protein QJS04_geneDACA007140 [Acorus gramineus]|uniref:Heparan-alpha-glucosaminide N-acetyltransferase catalytic domain-containing protein n=1 Tax=Acorus gramineus TaxID=55184 RepID=A0AAV9BPM8_ACOGR|nr:hypothetical protein QJS04_geneDACA007140 [Acorus gramineus]
MDSIVVAREEEQLPLLRSAGEDEIHPLPPDQQPSQPTDDRDQAKPEPSDPNRRRLVSLDVFRGLTVALMILVDDAGGAFPSINHSPWFGVTIADFVMPFFLFGVGVSVALVFKKASNKSAATMKVVMRTIKLFVLGLILQGGYFHGRNDLTYGVDVDRIRWLGVLQRISIGYFLAALSEIWLVNNIVVNSPLGFLKKFYVQWVAAILLCSVYLGLLYGLYVPNWEFEIPSPDSSLLLQNIGSVTSNVFCGIRGSLQPPCNAVGLVDRVLLGEKHLYQRPVYRRTKQCSTNSPDYGPLPTNSPGWCLAPFDPEGLLSSLMAAVSCFIGLHYGHLFVHIKVDIKQFRRPTILLQWMGMNALIVYALAAYQSDGNLIASRAPFETVGHTGICLAGDPVLVSYSRFPPHETHIRKIVATTHSPSIYNPPSPKACTTNPCSHKWLLQSLPPLKPAPQTNPQHLLIPSKHQIQKLRWFLILIQGPSHSGLCFCLPAAAATADEL